MSDEEVVADDDGVGVDGTGSGIGIGMGKEVVAGDVDADADADVDADVDADTASSAPSSWHGHGTGVWAIGMGATSPGATPQFGRGLTHAGNTFSMPMKYKLTASWRTSLGAAFARRISFTMRLAKASLTSLAPDTSTGWTKYPPKVMPRSASDLHGPRATRNMASTPAPGSA
jgi:hypothetical protein